jgi:2,3,4,5-tetrahydropyridine-2-carboxylate N-succinyltransferase
VNLEEIINRAFENFSGNEEQGLAIEELLDGLDKGKFRAAQKENGLWKVNAWVKKGILLAFRTGNITDQSIDANFKFFDKHNIPLKKMSLQDKVRIVPGGSSVRRGSYLAAGVVIMPPAYVNIGAYVDEGTMIDSHALVGSCAQIGKNVHLSAAAQIGGVLEPIGNVPVIIEDNVIIGGNVGIFEGTCVQQNAVIGAGVNLTKSTPVYDCVREQIYRAIPAKPLTIPEGAVVVPGSRPVNSPFGKENNLAVQTPIIIKYRDANTDAATALEEALR